MIVYVYVEHNRKWWRFAARDWRTFVQYHAEDPTAMLDLDADPAALKLMSKPNGVNVTRNTFGASTGFDARELNATVRQPGRWTRAEFIAELSELDGLE